MYDIPATTERHRTFGSSTEPPERTKRSELFDTPISIQLQPPSSLQHHPNTKTNPSPITPITPSSTPFQPRLPLLPSVLLFRRVNSQSYPSCLPSYVRTLSTVRAGRLGNQSIACDNVKAQFPFRYLAGPVYLEARTLNSPVASFVAWV